MKVKRLWVLLLALFFLSCSENAPSSPKGTSAVPSVSFSEEEGRLGIVVEGVCRYTVIRPETASERVRVAAGSIDTFLFHHLDTHIFVKNDFAPPSPWEILVGETNREESQRILAELSEGEFAVECVGRKLVIVGRGDKAVEKAVEWFLESFVKNRSLSEGEIPALVIAPEGGYRGKLGS